MNELWTIEQLAVLVETALRTEGYNGQSSGRVRPLPDIRTIRYYTTTGLLDPPAVMRGRKAFYGRRHVLQLVAVKRLQAKGMSLVQIQQALSGADASALARWAALPDDFWDRAQSALPADQRTSAGAVLAKSVEENGNRVCSTARPSARFWATEPVLAASAAASPTVSERPLPRSAVHLPVAEGVMLIVEGIDPGQVDRGALVRLSPILESLGQILRELRWTPDSPKSRSGPDSETASSSQAEE